MDGRTTDAYPRQKLKSNMAAMAHNVFSFAEILKIFLLETTKPIEL
jgi:hypothetical protein